MSRRFKSFHPTSLLKHEKVRLEEEVFPLTKNFPGSAQGSNRSHLAVLKQVSGGYLQCLQGPSRPTCDDLEQPHGYTLC